MGVLAVLLVAGHGAVMFTQVTAAYFVDSETGKEWREEWVAESPFRDHDTPRDIPRLLWRLATLDYGVLDAFGAMVAILIRILAASMLAALLLLVGVQLCKQRRGSGA